MFVSCVHTAVLSRDSVCIHCAMRRFASPKQRICREVVLLFIRGVTRLKRDEISRRGEKLSRREL